MYTKIENFIVCCYCNLSGVVVMEVVSIRVPRELREEMRRLDVDWAEYLRGLIEAKVRQERVRRACESMDEIRGKTVGVRFDSVGVIREARDAR